MPNPDIQHRLTGLQKQLGKPLTGYGNDEQARYREPRRGVVIQKLLILLAI